MSTLIINIPPQTYEHLVEKANATGKSPETLALELVEATYGASTNHAITKPKKPQPTLRQILEEAGLTRPLSDTLRAMIVPGVTLEEVQEILTEAGGPSLSEIIDEQRGPKS